MTEPLWRPSEHAIERANMTAFMRLVNAEHGTDIKDYAGLHAWSLEHLEAFWTLFWQFGGIIGERGATVLADGDKMPGAQWFPDSRINFAENLLRRRDEGTALVFWGEDRIKRRMTHAELWSAVARLADALAADGVGPGDRVAGVMPNVPETMVAMLAATSLGAIWSSCSPDFGVQGIMDRFGQIEPKVMFGVESYAYNGKAHDCGEKLAEVAAQLTSLKRVVIMPYLSVGEALAGRLKGGATLAAYTEGRQDQTIAFSRQPFNHPLYIMYSSGTTGVPKCIVHGAGGTLMQQLKEHLLHVDIKPDEKLFYFTTCGWMMWNWLAAGLSAGATLMLFDGSPFHPSGNILFDYCEAEGINVFGTSAKFIDACAKADLKPRVSHDLSALRAVLSTGSPLVPESFDYVYRDVKGDVMLASISGGTDILSCFALGNPILPVWRGELQCRGLAMAVEVWDDERQPLRGEKGELVCVKPFPSMPIGFWNDPDGEKYRAAYFERFPGVWCHGDYVELTEHEGIIIYGRSDAVLNPGGVRIGTAEIYRQVEQLPEVLESLVIGQDWDGDVRVVLFVRLREDLVLDETLIKRIKDQIRKNTTPRHVPAKVVAVTDIPRTKSGKIVELAVRHVVHGRPVKNVEALANPEALEQYRDRDELRD